VDQGLLVNLVGDAGFEPGDLFGVKHARHGMIGAGEWASLLRTSALSVSLSYNRVT